MGFNKDLDNYYNAFKRLRKYGIGSKVVCDIGEYYAEKKLGIHHPQNKSYPTIDGFDSHGNSVQIKTRHWHNMEKKAPYVFRPFHSETLRNVDYALLIILNEHFGLGEMWRVDRRALKKQIKGKTTSFHLTSGIKKWDGIKQLYPAN